MELTMVVDMNDLVDLRFDDGTAEDGETISQQ